MAPSNCSASAISARLESVRERAPLVQCLTNWVTGNLVANALLAVGATPAMTDVPTEAGRFARVASAVLMNVGTPNAEQRTAMLEIDTAGPAMPPWVLDPVAVGTLPVRTELAHKLAARKPTVVRGNASEVVALAGDGGRGVDSLIDAEGALGSAQALARRTGGVVAVSGAVDVITDGETVVRVAGGHPFLARITGGGCALGGVIAAFLAEDPDPFAATVAASAVYAVSAEIAAERASGPGSFAVAFVDALASVSAAEIAERARAA